MKLETFITNFMTDGSKDKYVKSIIKSDYIPYATKCSDCERIIRSCHYTTVDDRQRFVMNSPAQAMMFALVLVDRYTKIDIEYSADEYDELQKSGALGMIVSEIPEAEYQEYSTVLSMSIDDCVMKETNLASRFDDIEQAVRTVSGEYLEVLSSVIGVEEQNGNVLEGTSEGI